MTSSTPAPGGWRQRKQDEEEGVVVTDDQDGDMLTPFSTCPCRCAGQVPQVQPGVHAAGEGPRTAQGQEAR